MGLGEEKSQKATYGKVKGEEAASKMMGEAAVLPASTSVHNPASTCAAPCLPQERLREQDENRHMGCP